MKRMPIIGIVRTAITTAGEKYQTIASHNKNYKPYEVMGTYTNIKDARSHYVQDMDEIKEAGNDYRHFGIIRVNM